MQDLKKGLFQFAVEAGGPRQKLPKGAINNAYANQLVTCSSSRGANYRAALKAKSTVDYICKPEIAEEARDESMYFLELLHFFNPDERSEIDILLKEANKLLSIMVASIKTSKPNSQTTLR